MNVNWLKALVAVGAIAALVLMVLFGDISGESAMLLLGTIVGYVLGNGVQARHGGDVPGIIRPSARDRRADDPHEAPAAGE